MIIHQIEDGLPTPDQIEEILIRSSTGNPNPQISEEQLRDLIERNLQAANEPLPPAANDPGPLEEIRVTGQSPVDPADLARFLLNLLRRGGMGYLGVQDLPPWLEQALQESVNEITEETLKDDDEVQDALITPGANPALEEVFVYPEPGTVGQPARNLFPGKVSPIDPQRLMSIQDYFREHVVVTAKRLPNQHVKEITFPWELIEAVPVHRPYPVYTPGYKPFPESLPEELPVRAPDRPPRTNPDTDPANDQLPGNAPFIQGKIELTLDPNLGLRLKIARQPARNLEENRLRQDKKDQKAQRTYRTILYFVNKTYGELTELQDLYQVITQNIFVDGRPLYTYKNPWEALKNADDWTVDWEQMALDYAAMEAQDRAIGKASKNVREVLNEIGYYGPNPGSYIPEPPTGP